MHKVGFVSIEEGSHEEAANYHFFRFYLYYPPFLQSSGKAKEYPGEDQC